MESSSDFDFQEVCGTKVLVWKLLKSSASEAERKRRKKLRVEIGSKFRNMPMLDLRRSKNSVEFCDVVISSTSPSSWKEAFCNFYGSDSVVVRDMSSSMKLVVQKVDKPFLTISIYQSTGTILCQPADNLEKHLLDFLGDFPSIVSLRDDFELANLASNISLQEQIRDSVQHSDTDAEPQVAGKGVVDDRELAIITPNPSLRDIADGEVTGECGLEEYEDGEGNSLVDCEECEDGEGDSLADGMSGFTGCEGISVKSCDGEVAQPLVSCEPPAELLRVVLPACPSKKHRDACCGTDPVESTDSISASPNTDFGKVSTAVPDGYTQLLVRTPPMPLGYNFNKQQFIVNEVLCFVQNKMDNLPRESIVNMGKNFFDQHEILHAKKLLYELIPIGNRRLKVHRGDNKKMQDLNDIFFHLQCAPLMDTPLFLALDIAKLPPLSGHSSDLSSVLSNMEALQSQVDVLTEAQKVATDFMVACKSSISSEHVKHSRTKRDKESIQTPSTEARCIGEQSLDLLDISGNKGTCVNSEKSDTGHVVSDSNAMTCSDSSRENDFDQSSSDDEVDQSPTVEAAWNTVKTRIFTANKPSGNGAQKANYSPLRPVKRRDHGNVSKASISKPRERDDRGTKGSGSAPGLRAVIHRKPDRDNKICSGVFLTRLLPNTTSSQIDSYVKAEAGFAVRAEKLKTKYDSYSSFYIRCNGSLRTSLLDGRMWPKGTLVKPYMS